MKALQRLLASALVALLSTSAFAQNYPYKTIPNDPLKTRIYTLKNGLTVFLSDYKQEPRIMTFIAVRAGSKNDPSDATGLAHYLEHLLFKGTDRYSTLNFAKEKPYLDEIENLYEVYRGTRDTTERKTLYHAIDSVSQIASHYAVASEYDKMVSAMGARYTNAFTSNEETVYMNDIPANQLHKWITLEAERFRHPVIRLFHTELEAVYEEKNRHLDNDESMAYEALYAALFQNHPYGTQTTIGTIDHLKNPSIKKIKAYFNSHYIPNNMAIILSGDLDYDKTIRYIDEAFGKMESKPIPEFHFEPEASRGPQTRELTGPQPEQVTIAYRLPGAPSPDTKYFRLIQSMLQNGTAGLLDLDLSQQQKVLTCYAYPDIMQDYSTMILGGQPNQGQTLEQVRDLLIGEIEKLKRGEFDQALVDGTVNHLQVTELTKYQSNYSRASELMQAFVTHEDPSEAVNWVRELDGTTKAKIVEIANKYFGTDYAVVLKRTGELNVQKVTKPAITPVTLNRDTSSTFERELLATPAERLKPQFIDYQRDMGHFKLSNGAEVHYVRNDENELFNLYYTVHFGKHYDKKLAYALTYLPFLGTETLSREELKKKLFALGATFHASASDDRMYVSMSGLDKNFDESVKLFEEIIHHPKADAKALADLNERELKKREDEKKDKEVIRRAMQAYGTYGKRNPFNDRLTSAELRALSPEELVQKIKSIPSYEHEVFYYGPRASSNVVQTLNTYHATGALQPVPVVADYPREQTEKNRVYFVNYPMQQAEIVLMSKSFDYDPTKAPVIEMYNEYFGGSMSSVVFQQLRESKALAYAVWSNFIEPDKKGEPYYNYAYIGAQADKLPEALAGMFDLFRDLPRTDALYQQSKDAVSQRLESERTPKWAMFWNYEDAKDHGLDHDINQDVYASLANISFDQVRAFQQENVKGRHYNILVLGEQDKLDRKVLEQYGPVTDLTLSELFGD